MIMTWVGVCACACVNLRGAGVDILLLALRGKTAHGGGYGSRSPRVSGRISEGHGSSLCNHVTSRSFCFTFTPIYLPYRNSQQISQRCNQTAQVIKHLTQVVEPPIKTGLYLDQTARPPTDRRPGVMEIFRSEPPDRGISLHRSGLNVHRHPAIS